MSRPPQRFGDSRLGESVLAVWQAVTDSIPVPRTSVCTCNKVLLGERDSPGGPQYDHRPARLGAYRRVRNKRYQNLEPYNLLMTLVLAYANQEFVTIAADRRITKTDGTFGEDAFTKVAVVYNQFLVSFTGLAELGPAKQTMEWFVNTAAKFPSNFDFGGIAEEATKAVNSVRTTRKAKRLAFAGVGYDDKRRITYVLISNMHSEDGDALAEARDTFTCFIDHPPRIGELRCVGLQIPKEAGHELLERLDSSHGEKLPSINRVQKILAGAIAASAGKYISRTALVVSLKSDGSGAQFDVVTPSSKPGQVVDIASPYVLFRDGSIKVMPNQRLRRAKRGLTPKAKSGKKRK